jgi:SAM-dependent methyltransferase
MRESASLWFDAWAEQGRGSSMAEGHWPMVSQILDKMNLEEALSAVDVGCGNGYAVRAMATRMPAKARVLGFDGAAKMIETAQDSPDNPANASFQVASADALPLEADSVERLLSVETLYYCTNPLATLKEWHRVLCSGGSIWLMVDYYAENPYSHTWPELVDVPMKLYSEKEYRQLLEKAGFTAVVSERLHLEGPLSAAEQKRFEPGWGYRGIDDVQRFRHDIGSLLVCGKKSSLDIN